MQSIYRTNNGNPTGTVFSDFVRNMPGQGKSRQGNSKGLSQAKSTEFKKLRFQKTVITPKYIGDELVETPLERVVNKNEYNHTSRVLTNPARDILLSKGERLNRSISQILRVEEMKESKLLKEVKINIDKGLEKAIIDKYSSTVLLREYGHTHEYQTKNYDVKDIIYGVIQDIKRGTPFNKLKVDQYIDIERILLTLLKNEQEISQKLIKHRTYITLCYVKHENDLLAILKELYQEQKQRSPVNRKYTMLQLFTSQSVNPEMRSVMTVYTGSIIENSSPRLSNPHQNPSMLEHPQQVEIQKDDDSKETYVQKKIKKTYQQVQYKGNKLSSMVSLYLEKHRDSTQLKFDTKLKEIMAKIEREFQNRNRNKHGWINKKDNLHVTLKTIHQVAEHLDQQNLRKIQQNTDMHLETQIFNDDIDIIQKELKFQKKQTQTLEERLEELKEKYQRIKDKEQTRQQSPLSNQKQRIPPLGISQSERKIKIIRPMTAVTTYNSHPEIQQFEKQIVNTQHERRQIWTLINTQRQFQPIKFLQQCFEDYEQKLSYPGDESEGDKQILKTLCSIKLYKHNLITPKLDNLYEIRQLNAFEKQRPLTSRAGGSSMRNLFTSR
ncbi:UNKNOWN [Stylonychia lemnae]|uniref:Uncharacterized protein n=1 Tax=Stylonychia lemnae TaxID=5949 RepID=A0A078AJD3_STYLE|nr:UNKNOWN [Stylonychia lemnae]|eukprot:CDW80883.1 UNKNOWN [Stylonychia lemnae]